MGHILVLNAGSSSLKCAVFGAVFGSGEAPVAEGRVERIGGPATLHLGGESQALGQTDHAGALAALAEALPQDITAIGHRVVHGGGRFAAPEQLTPEVIEEIDGFSHLAPLHQPPALACIRAATTRWPGALQVAAFDTGFHTGKPRLHETYALPRALTDSGIRRYGFHGLSCQSILRGLRAEGQAVDTSRIAIAHLGNGCSVTAVAEGRPVATSMGFTPLDGVMMGTRPGHLDPGVILHLMRQGWDADRIEHLLYHESGLLGVSGLSNDLRDLLHSPTPEAAEAIALFTQRVVEEIARMAATMGGLDLVVFCGGIGENAGGLRAKIMDRLAFLPGVTALARPTREEHEIACAVRAFL